MGLLTIGAFARAARLTPKALRLYDEVGLLTPAAVDPESGYRFYEPEQLTHARLIAKLRRIGMPLADIRTVCELEPDAAAHAVTAYWRQVAADTANRAYHVARLVEHLSRKGDSMTDTNHPSPSFHYAVRCDQGHGRDSNEDAAYASDRLLAVADGTRGAGAAASTAAVKALKTLELADKPVVELLAMLAATVDDVDRTVRAAGTDEAQPATTLTAVLRRGSQLALVHIGDTRVYLLRGGELSQLTQDHTWVQSQVDHGKLSLDQAAIHPRRALLTRALGGNQPVEADLALRTALADDRYLLCTDGLSAVVDRRDLHTALAEAGEPEPTAQRLIDLAYAAGAPDNIACIVADVVAV
ncbi:MerR family transcriptional regulator [Micromonospora sp. 15K316]|uniref:MerR family transcriptional regulator n=1 Tax=Micromonospora sp. 15K316 TaxID=2530376 RepID=UPI001048DB4B|nr:MerR family transcriptional regulator [Micromonospora sp. 15K316]TDC35199.1 MerR family transcriptional regulator [Micromonospora sp. 15K316]